MALLHDDTGLSAVCDCGFPDHTYYFLLYAHANASSGARCLIVGLSLYLLPYFVYASSEGPGATLASILYSKSCLKRPIKNRQNKDLNDNSSLMQVESIAECSPLSILQYF